LKAVHYLTISSAILLVALLYKVGNNPPPKKASNEQRPAAGMPAAATERRSASTDSMVAAATSRLPKNIADSVKTMQNELTTSQDKTRLVAVFNSLAGVYQRNGHTPIAVFYQAKAAKLENSPKKLTFAAQLLLELMQSEHSASVQVWETNQAVEYLESSLKLDSAFEDTKLALATAYIEGTGEPMKGVMILRDITTKNPDDIPANMLLGRMSIQSGQFDKAVKRFETVLKTDPDNTEAMYFIAQAFEGTGDKNKARQYLVKCRDIVNKPEFSKEINEKINSLQ
jgi:lipopolysaccharide biosynthesis regulator YciM